MLDEQSIIKQYDAGASTLELADKYNTYPNKIRRILKKRGRSLRDRSKAQQNFLKKNPDSHPTKGKELSEETKQKVTKGLEKYWDNLSDKQREKRSDIQREVWNNTPKEQKEAFQKASAKAIRRTTKHGSKLERALLTHLNKAGYRTEWHVGNLVVNEQLKVDLLIRSLNIAIEVNGLSHYEPIWGEDSLDRQKRSDAKKRGLLLTAGYNLVIIKHTKKHLSKRDITKAQEELLDKVQKIEAARDTSTAHTITL